NYPKGSVDKFQYCLKNEQGNYTWREETIEGTWFPDAFIGSMGSLMRYKLGETDFLPASVEDVLGTMIVVDKAYESSDKGGEEESRRSLGSRCLKQVFFVRRGLRDVFFTIL